MSETTKYLILDSSSGLYFVKSSNIQVYPCGRRRTQVGSENIPIDPESKIITEENNRRSIALNGYTQNFIIESNSNNLIIALAGYFFKINFPEGENFITNEINSDNPSTTQIYANLILSPAKLYESESSEYVYNTTVLGDISKSVDDNYLDRSINSSASTSSINDYYFSGLAFSNEGPFVDDSLCINSLCIFKKSSGIWSVCEEAKLPKIEHGSKKDSVVLGGVTLNAGDIDTEKTVSAGCFKQFEMQVPSMDLKPVDENKKVFQLNLYMTNPNSNNTSNN